MWIRPELEVHLLAPRLRDVRVGGAHEALLVAVVAEEERADALRSLCAEPRFDSADLLLAVLEEEVRLLLARRRRVDHIATLAMLLGAEVRGDRLGGAEVTERGAGEREPDARRHGDQPEGGARARPRGTKVEHEAERALVVTAEDRPEERGRRERGERAEPVREERRARVDHRVVERPAEVADERIEGEDHRRRVEAVEARNDARDRSRECEQGRDEAHAAYAPSRHERARELSRGSAPDAAEHATDPGREREIQERAPELADADARGMEERREERERDVREPGEDAAGHRGERRRRAAPRAVDRRRDRSRGGDDQPRSERLLVTGTAEERQKSDRAERYGDDDRADEIRARKSAKHGPFIAQGSRRVLGRRRPEAAAAARSKHRARSSKASTTGHP